MATRRPVRRSVSGRLVSEAYEPHSRKKGAAAATTRTNAAITEEDEGLVDGPEPRINARTVLVILMVRFPAVPARGTECAA